MSSRRIQNSRAKSSTESQQMNHENIEQDNDNGEIKELAESWMHMMGETSDDDTINVESDPDIFSLTPPETNAVTLASSYKRQTDGSVTFSVRLDKDQVECCVCLSSMTDKIYCCHGNRKQKSIRHNICASCHWNISRMKAGNGHTKQMQCPICKIKGSFIRNYPLERQLTELSNECIHSKYGCKEHFFPWDTHQQKLHQKHLCIYQPIDCPFCYQSIKGGRINFIKHLTKSTSTQNEQEEEKEEEKNDNHNFAFSGCKIQFYESKIITFNKIEKERNIIQRNRNEFIINYHLGMIICFIAPTIKCECWKVYCISISPRHKMYGNSRIYIQYSDYDKMSRFIEKEQSLGLIATTCLNRPTINTLILSLNRLHPTSLRKLFNSYPIKNTENDTSELNNSNIEIIENDNSNSTKISITESELDDLEEYKPTEFLGSSPCSPIECGFIYGGYSGMKESIINKLYIRIFTLEESLKVGSIIDARDFTGEWYQVEIVAVQDFNGNIYDNLDNDICKGNNYLEIRKAKVHYLGYSKNYDEWLNIDTDSHRIAHRGTFTVGPDFRSIKENTTTNNNNNNNYDILY